MERQYSSHKRYTNSNPTCEGTWTLEEFTSALPEDRPLHQFSQIFPSVVELNLLKLHSLQLKGLICSYKDFAELLFLSLPNLIELVLRLTQIVDGDYWEDIVGWLRRLILLQHCYLAGLEYAEGRVDYFDDNTHMEALDACATKGGRHPCLPAGALDSRCQLYIDRLSKMLDALKALRDTEKTQMLYPWQHANLLQI